MTLYIFSAASLLVQALSANGLGIAQAFVAAAGCVSVCWRLLDAAATLRRLALGAVLGSFVGLVAMELAPSMPAASLEELLDEGGASRQAYEFSADVDEPPKCGVAGATAALTVREVGVLGAASRPCEGRLLLSVRNGCGRLRFGNTVRFRSRLRRVANFGNPGEFDFAGWSRRRGIGVSAYVWNADDIQDLGASATISAVTRWRVRIARAASQGRGDGGAFTTALVVGDGSGLSPAVLEALRKAGLSHLLAISGMNVAVVAASSLTLFGLLMSAARVPESGRDPYRLPALATAVVVVVYALLSGGGDSVVRSTVMGLLGLAALWRGRPASALQGLAVAAAVLAVIMPGRVGEVGFQLTFVATAAVIAASRAVAYSGCRRGFVPFLSAVAIALWCWGVTAPLLAYHFHRVAVLAPVAGLLTGAPAAVVVMAGLAGSALSMLGSEFSRPAFELAAMAGEVVLWVARAAASHEWAEQVVPSPGAPLAAALATLPLLVLLAPRSRRRAAIVLGLVVVACTSKAVFDRYRTDRMDVLFASVGQGDATIVRLPGGRVLVADAGPPGRGRTVVGPLLRRMRIGRIDYFIVSHAQDDHWGGLSELAGEFEIRELWYPGGSCRGRFPALLEELRARGTRVIDVGARLSQPIEAQGSAPAGRRARLVRRGPQGWRVRALWPRSPDGPCDQNDRSVVVSVGFARRRMLLVGDVEGPAERALAGDGRLRADVLKVPHHGSRTSSSGVFLAAVEPLAAVASLGRHNRFRFPHPEVVARYERAGIRLFRTDRDGAVRASVSRGGIALEPSLADPADCRDAASSLDCEPAKRLRLEFTALRRRVD